MKTVIYPVRDLDNAKVVYAGLLGVAPVMDEPYYVQFATDELQVGLDPHGHAKGMTGPILYWHVPDIGASLAALEAAGATRKEEPQDVGGGRLVATVADADGNLTGLIQE